MSVTDVEIEKLCKSMKKIALRNTWQDSEKAKIRDVTKNRLISWGVLAEESGKVVLTNAYALLTGTMRMQPVIQCGVFKGTDRAYFVDRRFLTGSGSRRQPALNGKSVYENPFCLPLAFRYEKTEDAQGVPMDPFEYQNSLYRELTGDAGTELYIPVPYRAERASGDRAVYRLDIPEGNYALYGNLEWGNEMDAISDANGSYETGYVVRISPSVFYIPAKEGAVSAYVLLQAMDGLDIREEQFYALDLDALLEAERQISQKAAEEIEVENGYARFVATRQEEGEYLFTFIPYDPGWRVEVDGVAVEAGTFGDCLMTIK